MQAHWPRRAAWVVVAAVVISCRAEEDGLDAGPILDARPADAADLDSGLGHDAALDAEFDAGPDAASDAGPGADAGPVGDAGPARAWAPSDVSILWPVPTETDLPVGYLRLVDNGRDPILTLPADGLAIFPDLHSDVPGGGLAFAVVVALRVDPCAPTAAGPCVRELRLSAETLSPGLDDAAVHLIYELDEPALAAVIEDLWTWRAASPVPTDGPLGVHPGLAASGIDSSYARALHALIARHATPDRLVRLTFNTFAFDNWSFRRFDRVGGGWSIVDLPNLPSGTTDQIWLRQAEQDDLDDPTGTIDPSPTASFAALLRADALANGTNTPAIAAARDLINELESPSQRHAADTDCASCHLAGPAHLWAEQRGVDFDTAGRYQPPPGATLDRPRPPELEGNLSNTIAFGYHRTRHTHAYPSVSARVAAETAEVVAALRQRR